MATANITVIGSLLIEHIFFIDRMPDLGESFPANDYMKGPGGKGANAAIATYRACHGSPATTSVSNDGGETDIKVRMVGAIGKDSEGEYMIEALEQSHVDSSGVRRETGISTGKAFIMVEETDESRDNRLIYTLGANVALTPNDFSTVESLSSGTRPDLIISQLEIDLKAVEMILETAGNAGIKVLLNAAPANSILPALYRYVTHLVVNETEAAILSGCDLADVNHENFEKIARGFLDYGVENFVLTLGEDGAYYANADGLAHVKAFTVESVDPTGAGDTFVGAYAAEYVRQQKAEEPWDIHKAVTRANAAGALTVMKPGGQTGIPWANEINDFMVAATCGSQTGPGGALQDEPNE
ncbi:putative ribokinase [Elasticomyces elasticus]|nr:putative ribokinase [Elasticomyces elasticus]KAK3618883.1 putative ribokinase [Elasticomyces elasticus]KAK4907873.1 putative ribokinase [Elasticomyces elasticus]KAK5740877.1 putative ribokinase [Elasticomyces elasticus]